MHAVRALSSTLCSAALVAACHSSDASSASVAAEPGALVVISESGAPPVADDAVLGRELARADDAVARILAVPDRARTYENTVRALDDLEAELLRDTLMTTFLGQVSPDPEVRERGRRASEERADWYVDFGKHEGLYRAVKTYADSAPALGPLEQRLVERILREFRRAGLELPAETRAALTEVEKELNRLAIEFAENIRDDDSCLLVRAEELRGCPEGFAESLEKLGPLYKVPTIPAVCGKVWDHCDVPETRMELTFAYNRRGGTRNVHLVERMIELRAKLTGLLGYATFADYQTETAMAGNAAAVERFYAELRPKVEQKARLDFDELQQAKRQHTGDPQAELEIWDRSFYQNWLLATRYAVDTEAVREYFPLERVLTGLFGVTQTLFGLEYRDVTASARAAGRELWHADVQLFEVWDKASGKLLGEFYLDLFPRPNKYDHAAQFPLRIRKVWADGSVDLPLVALVCNFTKPEADKPSLMKHDEVETMFHEFGHCLHSILTESPLVTFSGTSVSRDFVEAPSQMLENWIWDADVLRTFALHYETGEPLPEAMLAGLIAAKNLGSGLSAQGQIFLGMTDLRYHMDPTGKVDSTAVAMEVYRETRLFEPMEGTYFQAAFGHLTGYAAGYYGYLWSLVYAQDMFGRFREHGLLDVAAGRYYREKILAQGGMQDELDLVVDYLGRQPNADAFLEHLGLTAAQ